MNATHFRERLSALLVAFVREADGADLSPLTLRDFVGNHVVEVRVRPECEPDPPDDLEQDVLALLAERGRLRAGQLLRALLPLDYAPATIKRRLASLARRGVIVRVPGPFHLRGYVLPTAAEAIHAA